jgi:hypothetical protein
MNQVVAKLLQVDGRTDRQTDMMKLTINFHKFVNVPKNCSVA